MIYQWKENLQSVEDEMFRLPNHISPILLNDIDNDDDHSDKDKNRYDDNDAKLYRKVSFQLEIQAWMLYSFTSPCNG